ncbi:hypothetical protein NPIL_638891 [Nephila pilipes]|uniref:SOCS box domain-containing protein n=1 Tax=Nephila pilipes TaxID=299642 RepID=A0A8X6NED5_NEPPI|nr:hypothetical protein NPIL_638891 [Nephila pilipes]
MLAKKELIFKYSFSGFPPIPTFYPNGCPIGAVTRNHIQIKLEYLPEFLFNADEFKKEDVETQLVQELPNLRVLSCSMVFNSEENYFLNNELQERNKSGTKSNLEEEAYFALQRKSKIREIISFFLLYQYVQSQHRRNIMIQCFRYIWRTHLTPSILLHELEKVIEEQKKVMKCPPYCYELLMSISSMYSKFFPELVDVPVRPRPLKHFCRYTIRKELQSFPDGMTNIDKLDLPSELKSYLWLKF